MNQRTQALLFTAVTAVLAVLTYLLLGTSTNPDHRALTAFAGFWNALPVRKIDKGLFAAIGMLILYPVLLRPLVLAVYKAAPSKLRFLPRKFIAASNFRLFLFALLFAAISGLLIGIGLYVSYSNTGPLINGELILGMLMGLMGLLIMNFQFQFAYIRSSLKKKELLESIVAIVLLLGGFVCIGHAIVA